MNEGLTGSERHEGEELMDTFSFFGWTVPLTVCGAYFIMLHMSLYYTMS